MSQTYRPVVPIAPKHDVFAQAITMRFRLTPHLTPFGRGPTPGMSRHITPPRAYEGSFPVGGGLAANKVIADETQVRAQGVAGEGVGRMEQGRGQ
jgi:PAB-dependent poly(A)-specific ribonuclease subunit 2